MIPLLTKLEFLAICPPAQPPGEAGQRAWSSRQSRQAHAAAVSIAQNVALLAVYVLTDAAAAPHLWIAQRFHGWMATTTIMATMISKTTRAQHISLRVFFWYRFASTRAVVPLCTYSTDLATCQHMPTPAQTVSDRAPQQHTHPHSAAQGVFAFYLVNSSASIHTCDMLPVARVRLKDLCLPQNTQGLCFSSSTLSQSQGEV